MRRMKELAKKTSTVVKFQKKQAAEKQEAAKRTAEFNWNAHQDRVNQTGTLIPSDALSGTDLLYTRPTTNRGRNREINRSVLEEQMHQAEKKKKQQQRIKDMEFELDKYVRQVTQEQHMEHLQRLKEQRQMNNSDMREQLDYQVQERRRKEELEKKESIDFDNKNIPHFEPTLDENGFQEAQKNAARQSLEYNTEAEERRRETEALLREKRVREGRAMLDKAKAAFKKEMEIKAKEQQIAAEKINRAIEAGRRAKHARDLEEEWHRKQPSGLNILEQVDHYHENAIMTNFHTLSGEHLGRPTKIAQSTYMKGTGVIA